MTSDFQLEVDLAMQRAIENGYAEYLDVWTVERIVEDLQKHDVYFEDISSHDLARCVQDWKRRRSS